MMRPFAPMLNTHQACELLDLLHGAGVALDDEALRPHVLLYVLCDQVPRHLLGGQTRQLVNTFNCSHFKIFIL